MPRQQAVRAAHPAVSVASIEEIADRLAPLPLFARLDREAQLAIAERSIVARYPAGATLMRQDESGGFACVLLDGEIDIFVEIPAGRIHIATVPRHHIVGELGVLTGTPRTATVIARTDVVAVRIKRDALVRLTAKYPSLGLSIVRELGGRQHSMNRSLAYLTYAANALGRDEYDADMLAEITNQPGAFAGFARAFASMADEIRAKQQRRHEMQAAAAIQQSILPQPLPRSGAASVVDLSAEMHPAREIGGDFYDYFLLGDDNIAVTIADVSGKGIPAALFMAVSRTILRSVSGIDDMAPRMAEANRLLSADNAANMFVTMFHGVVDLATGTLRYCNAGHNPPYLLRADGGREALRPTGIAFGLDADMPYRIGETVLQPGDALFLFTDGITEAFNPAGEEFGTDRLETALEAGRGRSAAELIAGILSETKAFADGAEQSDDITCLALRFRP
jgi:sigma-B regulation protein RsbU (phosphoserine phosphatase)